MDNEKNLNNEEVIEVEAVKDAGVEISDDVVAVIAGIAVADVQGVAGMAKGFAGGLTEALSGKKNMAKGIKVEITDKEAKIDVNIIVEYGSRIPDVAFEIQSRVKKSVKEMTGLEVSSVNVHVQGVQTPQEKEKETKTEEQKNNNEQENSQDNSENE